MQYRELLAEYVAKSKMTLREIAEECKVRGEPIDPSYISKLQTGRLPPPSEEVSRVLAEVLGGDANKLVYLGYLEKAPSIIRQLLEQWPPGKIPTPEAVALFRKIEELPSPAREKLERELDWLEGIGFGQNREQKAKE